MLDKNTTDEREELVHVGLVEFESALIGYAASIVKDEDRAKDVVQDTFIKLYEQDPEKVKGSLKAWLFTVCRNRCFDIIRKEKRMINVEDDQLTVIRDAGDDPSRAAERADEHSNVIKFLDRLPENQREVIRLKFEGDMSYKEISQVTQLSVSNVGFLIHAGIKRLRGLLSDQVA
ncbi:MAG: sigma-70 family RNA polymerase sigma factor [Verrucomicrobiota bacterium]|jgi:RNA polymerase sigma factor (sigma-70 family)|nr:sigma-70 family RNA polymerase sigma factor [Verrucomicrobiales bacterium]MEC9037141.1 sigma-70 family RNA polymerase sigma factor [Verrucomicrobiota bacterium]HAA86629.1 sigma-70 family RNA polymerase sigma factor [Verrucomicrobiales bacterium]|tara:strand:+ start:77 stop:601 length:525 start_codon:yes stop_codon:yes gene_type:complete